MERDQSSKEPRIEVVDDAMAEIFRAMTPEQKLRIASDMFMGARQMLLNNLRVQHPDWDEQQVIREAARRLSHGAV